MLNSAIALKEDELSEPYLDAERMTRSALDNEKQMRRRTFLTWLRRVHGWLGLWGALLGLLLGGTGILLNHRNVMKIPLVEVAESTATIALPTPIPDSAEALAAWLQQELGYGEKEPQIKVEKAHELLWNDLPVTQPESWHITLNAPGRSDKADYSVGNSSVTVKHTDTNVFSFLTRLHKGTGMEAAWVLLMDSIAVSIMVLALTGILLWTNLRRSKLVAAGLVMTSLGLALSFIWTAL